MKNIVIYSYSGQGYQEACQLEVAKQYLLDGHNVLLITCGKKIGICNDNRQASSIQCKICKKAQLSRIKSLCGEDISIKSLDELCSNEIDQLASNMIFNYSSIDDLKSIRYQNVEIGYAALSSYVTYTRNIDITFSSSIKAYLDYLMRIQVKLILIAQTITETFKPDLVVIHNGRFAHYKPIYEYAKNNNIDYLITETIIAADGTIMKEFFHNSIPHSIDAKTNLISKFWLNYKDVEHKVDHARLFFENRKYAKFAGDKIYVKDQVLGVLPDTWDSNKENILIFNSSEDEYFAISSEYDNKALFKSQLEGIKRIVENYASDSSKHFTLRVHPNLKNVNYKYHTELYNLNYNNLTIIPASSVISTYSLLDAADKVIVFGSTIGIESTYWGKPTINLAYALYENMDVVYCPKSEIELWSLIDNKDLKPKPYTNALPYGLYYISDKHDAFKFVDTGRMLTYPLFKKSIAAHNYYKILGSKRLYAYCKFISIYITTKVGVFCRFKRIPV